MGPVEGWFLSREFEFNATADSPAMLAEAGGCVFPDSYLRSLVGDRDECSALTPGQDEPAILALPFLALSGWVLTIGAVAGLGGFYRSWRTRRWARSQGVTPRRADRRRPPERHPRRSISTTSAGKPRSRRNACRPT